MIDRRRVVLGGLAGLIVPAGAFSQGGPGAPAGPPPAAGPAGQPVAGNAGNAGNAGTTGTRLQPRNNEAREPAPGHQADQAIAGEQPTRIQALVLSQSYQATPRLTLANTTRDAALIARSFQGLHFDQVIVHNDGTPAATTARIAAWLGSVDANSIALVYIAGHGVEIGGENLLVLEGGDTFLSLQALIQVLQQRAGVAILFLDACRNNPFDGPVAAGGRVSRAVSRDGAQAVRLQTISLDALRASASSPGPGRLRPFSLQGGGIKIIFSTDPANVALDGAQPGSRNSPFALALARRIRQQISLDDIVSLTTGDVIRATRRTQYPWSQGSIDRPIFLSGRRRRRQESFR